MARGYNPVDDAREKPGCAWQRARGGLLLLGVAVPLAVTVGVTGHWHVRQVVPPRLNQAAELQPLEFYQAPGSGPYKCGMPLATNQTAFILQEYANWKKKYLLQVDGALCVVRPAGDVSGNTKFPRDCVSEGTGYGMLLAAYLADRPTLDGLWSFSQKFLDQNGIMHWQIQTGQPNPVVGQGGATDADEDIAMALLVAAERWGQTYRDLAKQQIDKVWQHEIDHGGSSIVKPGDTWGTCADVDPSYFSPAWYKVFGAATGGGDGWRQATDAGFNLLNKCNGLNGGTGLTPQWTDCNCAVSPNVGKYPDKYWCDSIRVPLRMAISAAWHCDERAKHQAKLLATFFGKQGAAGVQSGYTIQGQPFHTADTENACSQQCFVVTAAATFVTGSTDAAQRADFWSGTAQVPGPGQSCYFCDILRLLVLLFTSGLMTEPKVDLAAPLIPSQIPLSGTTPAPVQQAAPPPAVAPAPVAAPAVAPAAMPAAAPATMPAAEPAPAVATAPAPAPESGGAPSGARVYRCGTPLTSGAEAIVLQEYALWKKQYLRNIDASTACVVRPGGDISGDSKCPHDCVSEGTGYGMLMAAYLKDRRTFDALWKFSQTYLDPNGLMNWWICPAKANSVIGKGGATDADEDIAMALIVAAQQWGSHYKPLAKAQVDKVWQYEVGRSAEVLPGDKWGSCDGIHPSYFSPAWYEAFSKVSGPKANWTRVINSGFTTIAKCNSRTGGTGLVPQWTDCNCEKSPNIGKYPEYFWCDSARVPLRMAIRAAWHCDKHATLQTVLLSNFFSKQGVKGIKRGYSIQGQPLNAPETENACTEQCFTVTAAATFVTGSTDAGLRAAFLHALAERPAKGQSCYACDTLRMLSLVFVAGLMPEPNVSFADLWSTDAPAAATRATEATTAAPPTPASSPQPAAGTQAAQPAGPRASASGMQIRTRHGLCLEVAGSGGPLGKAVAAPCDESRTQQRWRQAVNNGPLESRQGGCLDASYGVKSDGLSPVGTWHCLTGDPNQHWGYTQRTDGFGFLVSHARSSSAVCLRVLSGTDKVLPVKVQVCNSSDPEQQWMEAQPHWQRLLHLN